MNKASENQTLSAILFGKVRRAVLSMLFSRSDEAFYIRHILRVAHAGHGAVQRELEQLTKTGIVHRTVKGNQVYYQANSESPVFAELKGLITKTAGITENLQSALAPLTDRITIALIHGSVARGEENHRSDVDLLIVGNVTFSEVVTKLQPAQKTLGREINPTVYPIAEFKSKLAGNHHFLKNVLSGPKIFLIGDENELGRMAEKRLGDQS
jgi:predicted nucleotidyltransferase